MTTFAVGERVRTGTRRRGHTRLPGYLQRASGIVVAHLGVFVFPDEYVRDPAHPRTSELYTVAFDATTLFAERGNGRIHADLFAEYLECDR